MRILVLTPFHYGIGGAETFSQGLVKELRKKHKVDICTVRIEGTWSGVGVRNAVRVMPRLFATFCLALAKKKYDVVHSQGLLSCMIAVMLKRLIKYRVHLTLLALYSFIDWPTWKRNIAQWVFDRCDIIFVEGDNGKKDLQGFGCGRKIRLFYHWCDQDKFRPKKRRSAGRIRVLYIGRPIPEKGRHIVEEAEHIFKHAGIPGYEFEYIQAVPYKDLPRHYQMADVVVVPSLYPEGHSRVVIEAASCGCALIVSDRGSLPEQVMGWGVVFDGTAYSLSNMLIRVGSRLSFYQGRAYRYAVEKFSKKNAEVFNHKYTNSRTRT